MENVISISWRWLSPVLKAGAICAVIVLLVVPGWAKYATEHGQYESYVKNHRIFHWRLGAGDLRSTADPRLLAGDVTLIRKMGTGKRVFMISKYQDLLLFLAGKNTGFPWDDLMLSLVTTKELDLSVETIQRAKPAVLFVDRDIARSHAGEILNSGDRFVGGMQTESIQRAELLANLNALF